MTALGPIGALAVCDVQTVRVFGFDATGGVSFAGTVSSLRVRLAVLTAALAFVGVSRETGVAIRTSVTGGALTFAAQVVRSWLRRPLRFAKRKGIISRGTDG